MPEDIYDMDINEILQKVLKDSYDETQKDLSYHAEKVKFYNEAKEGIREEMNNAREIMSEFMELEKNGELSKISNNQIEIINKFEKKIPSIQKAIEGLKFVDKKKITQVIKDLNKIKKDVKNKRIKIKLANPNTPNIKLSLIQKLKYRKTKNL